MRGRASWPPEPEGYEWPTGTCGPCGTSGRVRLPPGPDPKTLAARPAARCHAMATVSEPARSRAAFSGGRGEPGEGGGHGAREVQRGSARSGAGAE